MPGAGARAGPERWSTLRRDRLLDLATVAIPGVIAAGLCLYQLDTRSLWLDEAASFSIASQHGAALGSALARDGGNMLGYYGLLHVLIGLFGDGTLVLRLPSVIGASAAVAVVARLGQRLWDRLAGAVAGVLAAVSLTLVYWGQDARGYALMIALIAGSFLALLSLLRSPRPSRLGWVAYGVVTLAAVYASLEAVLILPAQLVVVLWHRERARGVLVALLATAVGCIPLFVLAAQRGSGQLFWVPAPSWRTAKQLAEALASSGLQPGYYVSTGDALLILTGVLAFIGAARLWRAKGGPLVLAWLGVPVLLVFVASEVSHSIFQARYVLVALPALALLLAWTLTRAGAPRWLAVATLAAVVTLRALALAPSYGVSSEFWREATRYVESSAQPGDCLAFYPLDTRMPFEYYGGQSHRLPRPVLPPLRFGVVRSYVEQYRALTGRALAGLTPTCQRVWLVWSHGGRLGGPPVPAANFRRLQVFRRALELRYPGRSTRTFGRASPISIELFRGAA